MGAPAEYTKCLYFQWNLILLLPKWALLMFPNGPPGSPHGAPPRTPRGAPGKAPREPLQGAPGEPPGRPPGITPGAPQPGSPRRSHLMPRPPSPPSPASPSKTPSTGFRISRPFVNYNSSLFLNRNLLLQTPEFRAPGELPGEAPREPLPGAPGEPPWSRQRHLPDVQAAQSSQPVQPPHRISESSPAKSAQPSPDGKNMCN